MTDTTYLAAMRKMSPYSRFVYYINERFNIRERRRFQPREQWTRDPILRKYKFTNVRRAWDYTSEWLIENWYKEFGRFPGAGMAAAFARFFCYVPTFQAVGFPTRGISVWLNHAQDKLNRRAATGDKVFTSAYMIGGVAKGWRKVDWVIERYLTPVHESALLSKPWKGSIDDLHNLLHEFNGWGDFLTQEVVLDLMYTFVLSATKSEEKRRYGYAGPGAIRGLNRIHMREVDAGINRAVAQEEMLALWEMLRRPGSGLPFNEKTLTVHDIEFSLCEFDKYERALHGQGVPKQLFKPRQSGELALL